jgi:hypothetical protein
MGDWLGDLGNSISDLGKGLTDIITTPASAWSDTLQSGSSQIWNEWSGKNAASSATATNVSEAQKTRDWSTNMSNTAHQREVADLKAAGLNPILSATGGSGSSTPSGSTATAVKQDNPSASFTNILTSAADALKLKKELQLLDTQILKGSADANYTNTQKNVLQESIPSLRKNWEYEKEKKATKTKWWQLWQRLNLETSAFDAIQEQEDWEKYNFKDKKFKVSIAE